MSKELRVITFQDVFGEHPEKTKIGFLPYWDDRKVIYCANAIRSFDSNLETITTLDEENRKLREAIASLIYAVNDGSDIGDAIQQAEKLL